MTSKFIAAYIPSISVKGETRTYYYLPLLRLYEQDASGVWYKLHGDGERDVVTQSDVIDGCKDAVNWEEIRLNHFPKIAKT
jgi:hypothetical protein